MKHERRDGENFKMEGGTLPMIVGSLSRSLFNLEACAGTHRCSGFGFSSFCPALDPPRRAMAQDLSSRQGDAANDQLRAMD